MADKYSGPNAHCDEEATDGGSNNADNHNGVLLGRGIGIENHGAMLMCRCRSWTAERKNDFSESGSYNIFDLKVPRYKPGT